MDCGYEVTAKSGNLCEIFGVATIWQPNKEHLSQIQIPEIFHSRQSMLIEREIISAVEIVPPIKFDEAEREITVRAIRFIERFLSLSILSEFRLSQLFRRESLYRQ